MRELRAGFDTIVRTAPLGVRFRDALDLRVVADGLRVVVYDDWQPGRTQPLAANRQGVFVAHRLPGISGFGDDADVSPRPQVRDRFRLVVTDTRDRYLPFALPLDVPSDGLYAPDCVETSPQDADPYVPLYSAAARAVPAATIVVRCDLRRAADRDQAVPWAWLELRIGSDVVATGMSDRSGSALLVAPLPAPRERTFRASPHAPFDGSSWQVSLRALWHPARVGDRVPDFCTVRAQPEVGLLERLAPPSPLASRELRAGEPLAIATAGSSYLYVAA